MSRPHHHSTLVPSHSQDQESLDTLDAEDSSQAEPYNPTVLEAANLLHRDELTKFTQAQLAEPHKFIDKLEKRVAVLEQMETKKRKSDWQKMKQQVKQRELQVRVRKQNLNHQR